MSDETPASVDGGPDEGPVLKEVRRMYAVATNAARGVLDDRGDATYWRAQQDALSDLVAWLKTNEPRRTTTRDADLREEGRAQERARVVAYLRRRVERWRKYARPEDPRIGLLVDQLAFESDEIEDGKHAPTPDASQGSAPVARSIPSPEDCPGCAKVARHPGEGYSCAWHPAAPQDAPGRLEPHDWISQHAPGVEQRTFCSRCGADLVDEEAARWCKPTQAARGETGTPAAPQVSPLPGALALVHEQAEDAGLWFVDPKTAAEAYLQRALRALHAAVEASQGNSPEGGVLEGELAEALRALTDIVQGILDGEDGPDSFTLQPARRTLARYDASKAIPQSGTPKLVECVTCGGAGRTSELDEYGTIYRRCTDCEGTGSIPQIGTVKEGTR